MNEIERVHKSVIEEAAKRGVSNTVVFTTEYPKLFDPNPRWLLSIKYDKQNTIVEWEPPDDFGDSKFSISLSQIEPIVYFNTIDDVVNYIVTLLPQE